VIVGSLRFGRPLKPRCGMYICREPGRLSARKPAAVRNRGIGVPADPRFTVGTMSLADAWEHNATDWIAWARAPHHDGFWDGTWPALLEILPDSAGLILDLGCGEGRAGRQLLAAGRRVLGIERSPTLARAAATGSPALPVAQADAARLPLTDTCIDLAVASMSLLDMDDFESAIAETARVLRPGGAFCFAIVHPFDSACDSGTAGAGPFAVSQPYLASRRYGDHFDRDGLGITLASMHRPLSAYTTELFRAGLVITDLRERGEREIPWLLVVRAEKRS
jgi:SAM-dependent methyltransferase